MQLINVLALLAPLADTVIALPSDKPGKPLPNQSIECPIKPQHPTRPAKAQPHFKISVLIHKADNVTSEYFDQYWTQCDIPLALDCPAFTDNVVKFNAVHQTPVLRAELGALGYPMLDYDGIIEFWVKSTQDWQKVTSSECWQTVRADAKTFTKWPYEFMYGYEVLALDKH